MWSLHLTGMNEQTSVPYYRSDIRWSQSTSCSRPLTRRHWCYSGVGSAGSGRLNILVCVGLWRNRRSTFAFSATAFNPNPERVGRRNPGTFNAQPRNQRVISGSRGHDAFEEGAFDGDLWGFIYLAPNQVNRFLLCHSDLSVIPETSCTGSKCTCDAPGNEGRRTVNDLFIRSPLTRLFSKTLPERERGGQQLWDFKVCGGRLRRSSTVPPGRC